jgi:hypothetical protein
MRAGPRAVVGVRAEPNIHPDERPPGLPSGVLALALAALLLSCTARGPQAPGDLADAPRDGEGAAAGHASRSIFAPGTPAQASIADIATPIYGLRSY